MPQSTVPKHQRGKKKGRAPAHQNNFAFTHNPNSKKTLSILSLPNVNVCRRCYDKIEWRKKYRKYKPRTQLGKCNLCQQKRVKAAYHTICTTCMKSENALGRVRVAFETSEPEPIAPPSRNDDEEPEVDGMTTLDMEEMDKTRACAVCVKAYVKVGSKNKTEDLNPLETGERLTLRQRKTLERQQERLLEEDNFEDDPDHAIESEQEEDPFLEAVGGAGNLLTGEAYQEALLRKEKELLQAQS